jgi:hypothetical protein
MVVFVSDGKFNSGVVCLIIGRGSWAHVRNLPRYMMANVLHERRTMTLFFKRPKKKGRVGVGCESRDSVEIAPDMLETGTDMLIEVAGRLCPR